LLQSAEQQVGLLKQRFFANGVGVSVLGVGCGRVGSISNSVSMKEVVATLETAVEAGVNLFDTADIYGQGDSERILGGLLRRHRDRMFVVTKVGGRHSRLAGMVRLAKPLLRALAKSKPNLRDIIVTGRTATVVHDFSPTDLRPAVEASRRRLGVDQLHGLLLHSPSNETLQSNEIHDFLEELLHKGMAGRVGVSVDSFAALEAAVSIRALTMIQAPQDVAEQLPGTAALEQIRRRNIGLFVREILRRPDRAANKPLTPCAALSTAIELPFVTSAIVGLSTRLHFNELASSVS
jgi:aryl-alcohol dehydrogenase-like predicted oxidoreductase